MIAYLKKFFIGKELLPPKAKILQLLISLLGGTLSILVLIFLSNYSGNLLISAPFGASCVILYALPKSPLAQPRNVFFGHILSVAVGVFFLKYIVYNPLSIGLAVGVAIVLMQFFRCVHPPAGANPLVVLLSGQSIPIDWNYVFFPFGVGAVILILIALIVNNIFIKNQYPIYWLAVKNSLPYEKND